MVKACVLAMYSAEERNFRGRMQFGQAVLVVTLVLSHGLYGSMARSYSPGLLTWSDLADFSLLSLRLHSFFVFISTLSFSRNILFSLTCRVHEPADEIHVLLARSNLGATRQSRVVYDYLRWGA